MELSTVWFLLIAVLWTGYLVLEGFDFGVGMLWPVLGSKKKYGPELAEKRRRVLHNAIGPVWDGNEVWLLVAGGATFAAFPEWYATLFSGFYLALFLIVVALIVRVCAFEWRSKIDSAQWRQRWDWAIIAGSAVPALLWGVAFSNIVAGVPINADKQFTGTLFTLLNPYALLGGLTTLLLFALHGAVFLALKTGGEVREDAGRIAQLLAIPTLVVAGVWAMWTQAAHGKTWTWLPVVAAAGLLVAVVLLTRMRRERLAFVLTSLTLVCAVVLIFGSLFPNVMPSTTDAAYSLTVHNASSTDYTLKVMTWVALLLTPVVIVYQGWTYWVFRQRLHLGHLPGHTHIRFDNSPTRQPVSASADADQASPSAPPSATT